MCFIQTILSITFDCHSILSQNAVDPLAIVTMHSMKDHVIHVLDMLPTLDSVTVFLADVPKETVLSDLKYKMVDLEKVCSQCNHCTNLSLPYGKCYLISSKKSSSNHKPNP